MNLILAEMMSSGGVLWEATSFSQRDVAAGLIFLLLLCVGIAVGFALLLHGLKRPSKPADWEPEMIRRALPARLIILFLLMLVGFYIGNSMLYGALFDSVDVEPHTLIFQALFLQIPVLILLFWGLHLLHIPGRKVLGFGEGKTLKMLGLSVLFYLASIPIIWFYNLLYQIFLDQFGYVFYLQDVTQVFFTPVHWTLRVTMIFIAVAVAPFFEEVVFRGVFFPWAVRRVGLWPATAVVSLIFAGIHFHLPSFLPLFLLSSMFCLAYARTRSLWVPIGMHALFNGVTVLLLILMG